VSVLWAAAGWASVTAKRTDARMAVARRIIAKTLRSGWIGPLIAGVKPNCGKNGKSCVNSACVCGVPLGSVAVGIVADQHFALARVVGGGDDALVLHALDQRGGLVVAHRQPALDIGGRGLLVVEDDVDGAVIELVPRAAEIAVLVQPADLAVLVLGGDRFEI